MTESQRYYLEEYERYKDVVITPGTYKLKSSGGNFIVLYEVISVDETEQFVLLRNVKNPDSSKRKTLHWARKNLESYQIP